MNILVAFLGYKSETCLPKSKCLKSMPISIFFGRVLVNFWVGVRIPPAPPRKSAPAVIIVARCSYASIRISSMGNLQYVVPRPKWISLQGFLLK